MRLVWLLKPYKYFKFSKLQYNSLAFVAGFKRATDEGSLPKIVQYSPYYLPLNIITAFIGSNLYILFAIAAAGVVPCGGPKTSLPYIIHSADYICI